MDKQGIIAKGEYPKEPLAITPADTVVLQAAVEGRATHIVTGDKKQ
jgi:predicted nucleic acid-binding protein